jgi:excisionase family DNA binding protein
MARVIGVPPAVADPVAIMTAETRPLTYRVREVAQLLGVSPDSIYDAVNRGEIRYLRFGRAIRIPKFVVDEMVGEAGEATRA